jgi:molybdenum cofactor cytidylyltransferase
MRSIAGILLAAGGSERFGSDKLLAVLPKGERLIERALRVHLQSRIRPLIVVISLHLERTLLDQPELLSFGKLVLAENLHGRFSFSCQWGTGRMVANEDSQRGMSSSIHVGLRSLTEDEKADGVVISLADLPCLTPETINVLIDHFLAGGAGMLVPVFKNRTGHPVIIDVHRFGQRIHQIDGDMGLRGIIEKHPEEVTKIPWHNDSVIQDIDTPADMERLSSHD